MGSSGRRGEWKALGPVAAAGLVHGRGGLGALQAGVPGLAAKCGAALFLLAPTQGRAGKACACRAGRGVRRAQRPQSPPSSPLVEGISASGSRETRYFASEAVLQQRTYFNPVLVAYVLGLAAAFAANTITHKGGACASTRATPNTFAALFLLLGPRSL